MNFTILLRGMQKKEIFHSDSSEEVTIDYKKVSFELFICICNCFFYGNLITNINLKINFLATDIGRWHCFTRSLYVLIKNIAQKITNYINSLQGIQRKNHLINRYE